MTRGRKPKVTKSISNEATVDAGESQDTLMVDNIHERVLNAVLDALIERHASRRGIAELVEWARGCVASGVCNDDGSK